MIYYKVTWVYSVLSWVLPMTRFFKLAIAMWIMLPQFKGEFFMYHFIETHMLRVETYLLSIRMNMSSLFTTYCFKLARWAIHSCLPHISGDCILELQDMSAEVAEAVDAEIGERAAQNDGRGADDSYSKRDTTIIKDYQLHRGQFNQTLPGPARSQVQDFSRPYGDAGNRTMKQQRVGKHYDVQEMPSAGDALPYMQTVPDDQLGFDDVPLNQSINMGASRNDYMLHQSVQGGRMGASQTYDQFKNRFEGRGGTETAAHLANTMSAATAPHGANQRSVVGG